MGTVLSAKNLRERYQAGEREFSDVYLRGEDLRGANLECAQFQGATLAGSQLCGAKLMGANLQGANLEGADLRGANLHGANLMHADLERSQIGTEAPVVKKLRRLRDSGANAILLPGRHDMTTVLSETVLACAHLYGVDLSGVDLRNADLSDAMLRDANLQGTNLTGANLNGTRLRGAKVSLSTYKRSNWTPVLLAGLHHRGVLIAHLDAFPTDAQRAVLGTVEGLEIFFDTLLKPIDRYIVDGVIHAVLQEEGSECRVEGFNQSDGKALVRIVGLPDELEAVAETLHQRAWEYRPASDERGIIPATNQLSTHLTAPLRLQLSCLVNKGNRMELYELRDGEVVKTNEWSLEVSKQKALSDLLRAAFALDELERFLEDSPSTYELVSALRWRESLDEVARSVVKLLERHELINRELFLRLLDARGRRSTYIAYVATRWGIEGIAPKVIEAKPSTPEFKPPTE